jgi:hypothetical protein
MTTSGWSPDDDGAGPPAGGDPVCWLTRVCPECGRFIEDTRVDPDSHCPAPAEPTASERLRALDPVQDCGPGDG